MSSAPPEFPQLPADPNQLTYFAEGAANILYTYHPAPSTPPGTSLSPPASPPPDDSIGTPPPTSISPPLPFSSLSSSTYETLVSKPNPPPLLRLKKDLAHIPTTLKSYSDYHTRLAPLFPDENLLLQTPVILPPGLIKPLNANLSRLDAEGTRAAKRKGTRLADDTHALLLENMVPRAGDKGNELVIELKPKWLAQSPSAPSTALRCRTCALRLLRQSSISHSPIQEHENDSENRDICPMDLVAAPEDVSSLERVATSLLRPFISVSKDAKETGQRKALLVEYLRGKDNVLLLLRGLQERLDPHGALALESEEGVENLCKAMTLRDCTLFFRIALSSQGVDGGEGRVDVKIADLDLKTPTAEKIRYWKDVERRLIDEGWYTRPDLVSGCRLE